MLPPTLTAAETVELGSYSIDNLKNALASWGMDDEVADKLNDWWQAFLISKPEWPIALTGLDRMMPKSLSLPMPAMNQY